MKLTGPESEQLFEFLMSSETISKQFRTTKQKDHYLVECIDPDYQSIKEKVFFRDMLHLQYSANEATSFISRLISRLLRPHKIIPLDNWITFFKARGHSEEKAKELAERAFADPSQPMTE